MNISELEDLKQLAMQAELARPLIHETNNFLNNLLLQLAISEKSFPESMRTEWANVRQEAKKIAALFQQWQRQRKLPSEGPAKIELNQLVQETVEEIQSESTATQFRFRHAGEPLCLAGFLGDVHRLISLLLHYAIGILESSGIDAPMIEIEIARSRDRVLLRLRNGGAADAKLLWADFDDVPPSDRATLSLPALACKSLVERLEGDIRTERDRNGKVVLTIDLPLVLS